jgi:hypothetical protein
MKRKERKLNDDENSNDNNINTHSDFLIGKAVAITISFGMIKNVKTIDITSDLVNTFQSSVITQKISRGFSSFDYSRLNQKLISFWSSVKLTINIGIRYFIQNYLDWWRKGLLTFNEMKKDWFNEEKLKYLDNNINECVSNSVSKVIRLIERNIFFTDSLFYFSKRILLIKWSLLYYNSISSFTCTDISTEWKDNYLFYFWMIK